MSGEELKLVSIVVGVFNGAEYIKSCIESIRNQTYHNYEVIFIVDSRSTDGSYDLIEQQRVILSNTRLIMRTDTGRVSSARNIGIKESSGGYIWFLDVDDYPYPSFLEEMIHIIETTDSDAVFCNFFQIKEKVVPDVPECNYSIMEYDNYRAISVFTELPMYSWAHIQKTDLIKDKELYFFDHPTSEDVDQTLRELSVAKKVCYYNKPLYVYYKRNNTATMVHRQEDAESIENIARRVLPFVKAHRPEYYDMFKKLMVERLMRQIAFVKYKHYSDVYKTSIAHEIIDECQNKTIEMRVFRKSKLLYYLILYPFTHYLWDKKYGLWGKL